jgi:pyruvate,water dikinase
MKNILFFEEISKDDIALVGGKNASLGEMTGHLSELGITVPPGFATTVAAYHTFISQNQVASKIAALLEQIDMKDTAALARASATIHDWILELEFPQDLQNEIAQAYTKLGDQISVAVRSSATAEDTATASFAGQQETFLNVRGLPYVLQAVKQVYASLFLPRAINYRHLQGFAQAQG